MTTHPSHSSGIAPVRITIMLTREEDGWSSRIAEAPEATSQGDSASEAAMNALSELFGVLADDMVGG